MCVCVFAYVYRCIICISELKTPYSEALSTRKALQMPCALLRVHLCGATIIISIIITIIIISMIIIIKKLTTIIVIIIIIMIIHILLGATSFLQCYGQSANQESGCQRV